MKCVTWNCNGAFRKKRHSLDDLDADLFIIQECEDPSQSTEEYRQWAGDYLWDGESKHKGIGIFCRKNVTIEKLDWDDDGLQSFLPCRVNDQFNLVGIWTKHAKSPNFRYIGQLWKYLQIHKTKFAEQNTILCGDLNSNTCWDEWDRWWNHSDVVRELKEINVISIYHEFFNEAQGSESRPTLFHQRKIEKPYHVDFAFCSRNLFQVAKNNVRVGEPHDWLQYSDHMPLVFTVAH